MNSINKTLNSAHGLVVKAAMTRGERRLTGIVLAANLVLAAWLVTEADFSSLRPNAQAQSAIVEAGSTAAQLP